MKALTKCFYNIGVYYSSSKREGDNEAPSPLNKGGYVLAQYLPSSIDTLFSSLNFLCVVKVYGKGS